MHEKILIVDDHPLLRQGIRAMLSSARPDWSICGEAANGGEALAAIAAFNPDVLILDVTMPGMSGIEVAKRVRELGAQPRIVMFTMHESEASVVEARNAGADGFVKKSKAGRDLVLAIESVLSGRPFFA